MHSLTLHLSFTLIKLMMIVLHPLLLASDHFMMSWMMMKHSTSAYSQLHDKIQKTITRCMLHLKLIAILPLKYT